MAAKGKGKGGGSGSPRSRRGAVAPGAELAARLRRERDQARAEAAAGRECQEATDEILNVIARSPSDVQPVFDAIARRAVRLCKGKFGLVFRYDGELAHFVAHHGFSRRGLAVMRTRYPRKPVGLLAHALRRRAAVHTADVFKDRRTKGQTLARTQGYRSFLCVPMLDDGKPIGAIAVQRREAQAFTDHEIGALQTFAAQAVIAIENARLFNETKEGLEQQTAISEVLRVISNSPTDVKPVLEAVAARAARICDATDARIFLVEGETARHVAGFGDLPIKVGFSPLKRNSAGGRAVVDRRPVHIPDIRAKSAAGFTFSREAAQRAGWRTILAAPLVRENRALGYIALRRTNVRSFSERQITLLQTFADQAAIAIENVRLFNETRAALERQTASAEILRVVAGARSDTRPVFEAILGSALRLFSGMSVAISLMQEKELRVVASDGEFGAMPLGYLVPLARESTTGTAVMERRTVVVADTEAAGVSEHSRDNGRRVGFRAASSAPLLFEDKAIGCISVLQKEPGGLSEHQLALLRTFADQAVIAIENVRLFNETKEALERQTATAEILKVIASSPSDVQPVFDIIGKLAEKLCMADISVVSRFDGGLIQLAAAHGLTTEGLEATRRAFPMRPDEETVTARAYRTARVVHVADVLADPKYARQETARTGGFRGALGVPMVREGHVIGVIFVARGTPGYFTDAQVELLKTFADQAVIAIENVRLFNETKEALERQTATAEILRAISGSLTDITPVFEVILENVIRLCAGDVAVLWRYDGQVLRFAAGRNSTPESEAVMQQHPLELGNYNPTPQAGLERRTVHVLNVFENPDYRPLIPPGTTTRRPNAPTVLAVPLLRDGDLLGVITIWRYQKSLFSEKQVDMVNTFADQAVIAIENVRLFNETREALERQTATAEILKVIASSPSDVQPVFDAIAASARRLLDGGAALVARRTGDKLELAAYTSTSQTADEALRKLFPAPITGQGHLGKAILSAAPVRVSDIQTDTSYSESFRAMARTRGLRSVVSVPMLREGEPIGVISVNRPVAGDFGDHQTNLLKTFADQAVIAIENVRLFNETKEALERQKASAEILSVISNSVADTKPVFAKILDSCAHLFGSDETAVLLVDEQDQVTLGAYVGKQHDAVAATFPAPLAKSPAGHAIRERRVVHYADVVNDPQLTRAVRRVAELAGYQAMAYAPMLWNDKGIGAIGVSRLRGGFADKELAMLQTFADQAVIAIQNARLFNETKEALERQTATAEILKVISESPTDVAPVFDAIAERARVLCGALVGATTRFDGELLHLVGHHGASPEAEAVLRRSFPMKPGLNSINGRCILARAPVQIPDVRLEADYDLNAAAHAAQYLSLLAVPMLLGGKPIGAIGVTRREAGAFPVKVVELLQTFADQAVIAIQNVRLFNETKEALERQTATAEILKVIASSPSDVQPVFDTIVRNFVALCGSKFGAVFRFENGLVHYAGSYGFSPEQGERAWTKYPVSVDDRSVISSRAIRTRSAVHLHDIQTDPDYDREHAKTADWRRMLAVPMLREGEPLGAIVAAWSEAGATPKQHEDLLRIFADQAVIAIENVRLFNETKEALERQTATAEILKVISQSTTDVQPVLEAIVRSATKLFPQCNATVFMRDGDLVRLRAIDGITVDERLREDLGRIYPVPFDPAVSTSARAMVERRPNICADTEAPDVPEHIRRAGRAGSFRSNTVVPLVRDDEGIGSIVLTDPRPVHMLDQKQIALLQTFADQAVIAIENVRLFNETREALDRQTATAEILKVISSSPTDTQPVFDAIVNSALRLFNGHGVGILLADGEVLHLGSVGGAIDRDSAHKRYPMPLNRNSTSGTAILDCAFINIADSQAPEHPELLRALGREIGYRSVASAPMLREGVATGAITVMRKSVGAFSEKEVALLKTFADQAVIAIENVRLFKELQAQTEALTKSVGQLTALGEVGQAISSSLDLETVLQTIVSRAVQLTGMDGGTIYEFDERGSEFQLRAAHNMPDELAEAYRRMPIRLGEGVVGSAGAKREPVQVPDIQDPGYQTRYRELLIRQGYRAILAVPLLREDQIIGALTVSRNAPGEFAPDAVELLKTFATQSAMAIQNARLFREIAEKGRELEVASQHKSQFLASMSHELRTPLNAILGFNEMILGQVYGEVPADMQEPLKDIQTSGKHLLRLINNVLDLAKIEAGRMELSLADYSVHDTVASVHATLRPLAAEKGLEFLATVPEDVPLAYGDGGRMSQCLMNLAGNSLKFTKAGKVEISVATNGETLVYRVTDTGIGIAPDKIASLFTEFKQTDATIASEYGGTGLGLSISKKFVEMHGGRIWIESEPGKGSAFIIEVPLRVTTS